MTESLTEAMANVGDSPQGQEDPNYLDKLVGEGKKYSNPSQLARAYINADMHLNELREKLDEKNKQETLLNEVLATLRDQKPVEATYEEVTPDYTAAGSAPNGTQDIEALVDKRLKERTTQEQRSSNMQKSFSLLREVYGSDYSAKDAFIKAHNNDASVIRVLDDLAATNPEALKRFILGTVPPESKGGALNTPAMQDRGSASAMIPTTNGFNADYVRKIRKENPATYNSKEFRDRLERAVTESMAQGKDFFAT